MLAFLNREVAQRLSAWKAGSPHLRYLRTLERQQYDSPSLTRERQWTSLVSLVRHAWETVPFYRTVWTKHGLHPDALRSFADWEHFPILTKNDLRTHHAELRSTAYHGQTLITKQTSGSTGVPVQIVVDADAQAWKRAATLRADQWSGWTFGSRIARLWGHGVAERGSFKARVRRHLLDREAYLNTLHVTPEAMASFAKHLQRRPPGLLFGHAHSLYLFACYVQRHCPNTIHPDGVVSAAMVLHDWQRATIRDAFGREPTNRYGCEEVSLVACECAEHRGLHIHAEGVYVEVQPDPHRQEGRLLLTDLRNRAMPLLRYQVGDVAIPSARTCACGRGLPMLEQVMGRDADYVLTPDYQLISGISLTDHFATAITGAAQVQLVQDELRHLRVRIVTDERFDVQSQHEIAALVHAQFGPTMQHTVEIVAAIPQEPSGKYRFCISPVANEYLKTMAS